MAARVEIRKKYARAYAKASKKDRRAPACTAQGGVLQWCLSKRREWSGHQVVRAETATRHAPCVHGIEPIRTIGELSKCVEFAA